MQNFDIIFVQETHCHLRKDEKKWSCEWVGQSYWSKGTNRSKGVAILCNPRHTYDIKNVEIDSNGRYIKCNLLINDSTMYNLINLYAPNNEYERVKFFNQVYSWVDTDMEILMSGDYNCTLNGELDRLNCTNNDDIGRVDLMKLMNDFNVDDVYRRRYPNEKVYSLRRGDKASRIDYWLISESLDNLIDDVSYEECLFSDHNMVSLTMRTSESKHGKGLWKMNSSIILTDLFKKSFRSMWGKWCEKKHEYSDLNVWWDLGKKKIKDVAMWCSKIIYRDKRSAIDNLEKYINEQGPSTQNNITQAKNELKEIYDELGEGAIIRSRVNWFERGEKPSKYFHDLEKRNSKNKSIDKIMDSNGNIGYGTENVMNAQVEFYKHLYNSEAIDPEMKHKFLGAIDTKIPTDLKNNLNEDLNVNEITNCLKMMRNNKSPGPDGIVAEFYKCFWVDIKNDLLEVYNNSFERGGVDLFAIYCSYHFVI